MKKACFFILFFTLFCNNVFSKHIVGGEIIYDFLGGGNYRITLKVYRDCFGGGPALDGTGGANIPPAILTVFHSNGDSVNTYDIGAPILTNIPPSINNPCIQAPNNVCVEEGVYTYTLFLPPKTGGYYLVYQRCCRNNTILNLVNPGDQGTTYFTKVPGPEVAPINSSPRYKNFPPIFLCNNVPFSFDHSATDPDGDQLLYSLCPPYLGLDPSCPSLNGGGCPTAASPLPYSNVIYANGYSGSYPIASNPAFTINPVTGLLTGRPNLIGQFVVSVCIQEFRGNQLINVHYRDFQFNVTSCIVQVASVFADQTQKCQGNTIEFINQSFGNIGFLTYLWDFGVPGISSDTSSLINPTYVYPDTGQYVVTLIANPNKPCSDTLKKTFYVYPELQVNFLSQYKQCLKGNSYTFTNTSVHANSIVFDWDFTSAATPSTSIIKNPGAVVFNAAGLYFVKLIGKQFSCADTMIDSVRIIGRPKAKINNLPNSLCDPAKVGFSNGSSADLPLTFHWTFSNGASSNLYEPVQVFSPPGVYGATLMITTSGLCVDTSMTSVKNITVNPSPVSGFTFTPAVTSIFDPDITFSNLSSDDVNYWNYDLGDGSTSNQNNFVYPYKAPGTYTIIQTVGNQFGCYDTTWDKIKILPEFRFWIPNTFTPNSDGMNDIFMPKAIGVLKYQFDIYDKWGEHLFNTVDHQSGWDGRFKGKDCEQDVYVWKITFTNEVTLQHEDHYGHVLLLYGEK